jgi:hypothetical protein
MKLFSKAAFVAAIVGSSAAYAADLNEIEKGYIWFDVATTVATSTCGATEVPGGVKNMGERNGIDVNLYGRAIIAAASASMGMECKSSDLIPGVTQVYRLAQRTILDDLEDDKGFWSGVDVREGGVWKIRMLAGIPKAPPPRTSLRIAFRRQTGRLRAVFLFGHFPHSRSRAGAPNPFGGWSATAGWWPLTGTRALMAPCRTLPFPDARTARPNTSWCGSRLLRRLIDR